MIKKILLAVIAAVTVLPLSAATFQEVNNLIKTKKYEDAEKTCRELISEVKTDKDKFNAYMKLMHIMRRLNKNAELIKDADTFLADCKNDLHAADLLIYKGIGQRYIKQNAEALATFKLAVDKAKDGYAAREAAFYFCEAAAGMRKYAEAQEMYQRAKNFKGADKDARLMLSGAFAYWYNNKFDEAWEILEQAAKIEKLSLTHQETILRYRGNIMYYTKKYEEAVKYFDEALKLKISSYCLGRINFFKAQSLEKLNRKEEAVAAYKAALEYKGDAYFKRVSQQAVQKLSK